jgi:hypothetical protein
MTDEVEEVRVQTYTDQAVWHEGELKGTEKVIDFNFPTDSIREVTVYVYNPSTVTELVGQVQAVFPPRPGAKLPEYVPLAETKVKPGKRIQIRAETDRPVRLVLLNAKAIGARPLRVRVDIEARFKGEALVERVGKSVLLRKSPTEHTLHLGGEVDDEGAIGDAKIIIDLKNGRVETRMDLDDAAKLFWQAVQEFAEHSMGEGSRCSCQCGCNRKMATFEVLRKVCFACDAGVHGGKEAS